MSPRLNLKLSACKPVPCTFAYSAQYYGVCAIWHLPIGCSRKRRGAGGRGGGSTLHLVTSDDDSGSLCVLFTAGVEGQLSHRAPTSGLSEAFPPESSSLTTAVGSMASSQRKSTVSRKVNTMGTSPPISLSWLELKELQEKRFQAEDCKASLTVRSCNSTHM